jgi:hypothetical protein
MAQDVGADAEAPFCAAELASVLTDVEKRRSPLPKG